MSDLLRIRRPYLEALEQGRIDALPGRAYALAFLRTYATALGLDADEAVRRFKAEAAEIPDKTALDFPAPLPERGLPTGALLLLGLVLVVGAYAGWYRLSGEGRLPAETVQPVPARLAQLTAPEAPAAGGAGASATSTSVPSISAVPTSGATAPGAAGGSGTVAQTVAGQAAGGAQDIAATPATVPQAQAAPVGSMIAGSAGVGPPASLPANAASGGAASGVIPAVPGTSPTPVAGRAGQAVANAFLPSPVPDVPAGSAAAATPTAAQDAAMLASGASGLLVLATADAWVQVRSSEGAVVFSHLLRAGQSWAVPAGQQLSLTTGNAGGTVLVRNGVASAPLGAPGAVLHNVPLSPAAAITPASVIPPAAAAGTH